MSNLVSKSVLVKWKVNVDKIDIGKWETAPVDLNKLRNVVNNEVARKTLWQINCKSKSCWY